MVRASKNQNTKYLPTMFALLATLRSGEHADLRDSRTFETLYAVSETFTGYAENMALAGIPHADLRDNNIEYL